ncbi:nucleotidyltransferase [Aeromicrobium sp. Root236]|uniref:nucleotidyltransferase domain-containing protein n=1 Tax=Aeromicrobium sp. Root236 TaxID=1736498 RepID=UPI0006F58BC3|nr:nucleotidyltransferase domain-containing protein [Aeromicrobium sp. Root236]KRC65212.1 nucleotidyltransferase [Aeromicrobium sp. Root236]
MRAIPDSFDPVVVAEIDRRLRTVADQEQVTIPWAIESGSRAWGFPSPDSDYDCRFLYVRSESAYLSPWLGRDVIETPLDEVYDVNGWDLRKALQLLVKGNAVVVEWLRSPYVYSGEDAFRRELLSLADDVADRSAVGRHYVHVALGQWQRYGEAREMPLKKLFYVLRPAATVRRLEAHPDSAVPPMEITPLLLESGASDEVRDLVAELVALKARTREIGVGVAPPPLLAYAEETLALGETLFPRDRVPDAAARRERATEFFRQAVRAYGPS